MQLAVHVLRQSPLRNGLGGWTHKSPFQHTVFNL